MSRLHLLREQDNEIPLIIVLFARSGSNNKGAVLWKYTQMEVMTVCVI